MSLDSSAYVCPSERRPLAAMPTALARCCYGKVAGPPSRAGALPARRRQFAASARTDGYLLTCVVVPAIDGVPVMSEYGRGTSWSSTALAAISGALAVGASTPSRQLREKRVQYDAAVLTRGLMPLVTGHGST